MTAPNQRSPVHIGGVIDRMLKHIRPDAPDGMLRIWHVWPDAVGPEIAENARPAAVKGSLLLVHVSSSTWGHHLQFLKSDLIARLNAALGHPAVQDIKFKVGTW